MTGWLGLMIGNSRLHWAYHESQRRGDSSIWHTWDSDHLREDMPPSDLGDNPAVWLSTCKAPPTVRPLLQASQTVPLMMASVVPAQNDYWTTYPDLQHITLQDIPLANLYPTLGIDRALAVLGAWHLYQTSTLVVDGGTALTLSGVDKAGEFIGGAILPGLGLQLRSLHSHTAALPRAPITDVPSTRWQANTPDAIRSGVWYGLVAGIQGFINDWLCRYPDSTIVFTGGDGQRLWLGVKEAIAASHPASILYDSNIIFKGMAVIYAGTQQPQQK